MDGIFSQFETMFLVVFVISIAFFAAFFIFFIYGMLKGRKTLEKTMSGYQPIVKEKEIVREIVKIRCSYCDNLYDEKLDKCPHCGGKR